MSTGRGARAAAFWTRAPRRRSLRPGYRNLAVEIKIENVAKEFISLPFITKRLVEVASIPDRNACGPVVANPS